MSRFEELIERTVSIFGSNHHCLAIPDGLHGNSREGPSGSLSIESYRYGIGDFGELRAASIRSTKIDIVTMFFYPQPKLELPVYAMEFVQLGKKPIVAVMDAVAPANSKANSEAEAVFLGAREMIPGLVNDEQVPPWFAECRSGWDVFVRPADPAQFDQLAELHLRICSDLIALMSNCTARSVAEIGAFSDFVHAYRVHHHVNSPGLPLMRKSFGEDWTLRFMRDWFFADDLGVDA